MSESNGAAAPRSSAAKIFVGGLILGLVVGGFAGAVLPDLLGFTGAPPLQAAGGLKEGNRQTPAERRALEREGEVPSTAPAAPATDPLQPPVTDPAQPEQPDPSPEGTPPAPAGR